MVNILWMTRALWLTALFWPYAHAGGIPRANFLGWAPVVFSFAEIFRSRILRLTYTFVAFVGQLILVWAAIPSTKTLTRVFVNEYIQLLHTSILAWNQLNGHLAVPLLLLIAALGWQVFRTARNGWRITTLLVAGAAILPIDHVFWGLPTQGPLTIYMMLGLLLLQWEHSNWAKTTARPVKPLVVSLIFMAIPLAVGLNAPVRASSDPLGLFKGWPSNFFASSFSNLGSATVRVNQSVTPSNTPVLLIRSPVPSYWQEQTYTYFSGTTWSNPARSTAYTVSSTYRDLPLFPPPFNGVNTSTISAHVIPLNGQPITSLLYNGVPLNFSVPTTFHPSSGKFSSDHAVSNYRVTMMIPKFHSQLLSQDFNTALPSSSTIRQSLQVPHGLHRVSQLAHTITANSPTWWAKALAVKTWLDRHNRYSYHFSPASNDVVTHFLFTTRAGYCDQFSTTFIIMMRTLGIPARWVVGYASGTYSSLHHGYIIRAVDAHAWAQIYIPPYGWIPIDPTPGWNIPGISTHAPQSISQHVVGNQSAPHFHPTGTSSASVPSRTKPIVQHPSSAVSPQHRSTPPRHVAHAATPEWVTILEVSVLSIGLFLSGRWLTLRLKAVFASPKSAPLLWHSLLWWAHHVLKSRAEWMTPRQLLNSLVQAGLRDDADLQITIHTLETIFYGPADTQPSLAPAWQAFSRARRQFRRSAKPHKK